MKLLKICLKIDTFVQGLALTALLICGLSYLISFDSNSAIYPAVFSLYFMMFIGIWQFLSGIIFSTWMKGDSRRKNYLLYVLWFFVFAIFISQIAELLHLIPIIGEFTARAFASSYLIGAPLLLAGHYFHITFSDMTRAHYYKRSFWDLS